MTEREKISRAWHVNAPTEEKPWLIGLIVGASGSGKTTIAREAFKEFDYHEKHEWTARAFIDDFPESLSIKDITDILNSVGLSSPPHWLKPFAHLSNGQQFRVNLARTLLSGQARVCFDEFTSVVDREVAKICCACLSKTIRRKQGPQFIGVSCHYDIIDWLQPDWILDVTANTFEWRTLRRRPAIEIQIYPATVLAWQFFKEHHYLSAELSTAAQCFIGLHNGKPVAFTSYLHMPHPACSLFKREHRTVVLPDYQGIGIGNALSEWLAASVVKQGFRFISTTSHPAMITHRCKSEKWKNTSRIMHAARKGTGTKTTATARRIKSSSGRLTASFEFVARDYTTN